MENNDKDTFLNSNSSQNNKPMEEESLTLQKKSIPEINLTGESADVTVKNKLDNQNIDFKKLYRQKQIEFDSCVFNLVGDFNSDGQYKIIDMVAKELKTIRKTIYRKTDDRYYAYAVVNNVRLDFVVDITTHKNLDSKLTTITKTSTLKLIEKINVVNIYNMTIKSTLGTYCDIDSPNYLFKVRKYFNLIGKNENVGITGFKNYAPPPIELVTQLVRKKELTTKLMYKREELDKKYVISVLTELKKSAKGSKIVKSFVTEVKKNKLDLKQEKKMISYRQLLDRVMEESFTKEKPDVSLDNKIVEIKKVYVEELNKLGAEFDKNNELDVVAEKKPETLAKQAEAKPSISNSGKNIKSSNISGGSKDNGSKGGGSKSESNGGSSKDEKQKDNSKAIVAAVAAAAVLLPVAKLISQTQKTKVNPIKSQRPKPYTEAEINKEPQTAQPQLRQYTDKKKIVNSEAEDAKELLNSNLESFSNKTMLKESEKNKEFFEEKNIVNELEVKKELVIEKNSEQVVLQTTESQTFIIEDEKNALQQISEKIENKFEKPITSENKNQQKKEFVKDFVKDLEQ